MRVNSSPSETVWTSRSTLCMALFGVLSLGASQLQSPWWSGPLLDVGVRWPAGVVALIPQLKQADPPRPAPAMPLMDTAEEELPDELPEADPLDAPALVMAAPGLALMPPAPDAKRLAEDRQLIERLDRAISRAGGAPSVPLERPCIVKGSGERCRQRAMDAYFEALRSAALKQRDEPVRLTQYGDSLISGDGLTGELRRLMQDEFGDGGHGFVPLREASRFTGFEGIRLTTSEAWSVDSIIRSSKKPRELGVAGIAFVPSGQPSWRVRSRDEARTFNLIGLLGHADGQTAASVTLRADKHTEKVELPAASQTQSVVWVKLAQGANDVRLDQFSPAATYFGVAVERQGSGVVVDNMGLLSSKVSNMLRMDREHWRAQLDARGSHLVSLSFGANSAAPGRPSKNWLAKHTNVYKHVLAMARGNQRDCLVLGVLTRGAKQDDVVTEYASVPYLIASQREAAEAAGCAFWDMHALIPEEGPGVWYKKGLITSDFTHPTRNGYRALARAMHLAMLQGLRDYLVEQQG
jgi:hypothetical protein